MRTSPLAGLLLAACLPPEPPAWLIHEPTLLGIQTAVVVDGPYLGDLPVHPDHERADPLPLDTLEWRWIGAAPAGAAIRPPIWIACSFGDDCADWLDDVDLPSCPDPLPLSFPGLCRVGVGDRVRTRHADVDTSRPGRSTLVTMTAITSADLDPETCLERLRRPVLADLERCRIATTTAPFAPYYVFASLLPGAQPLPDDVPDDVLDEPPNTNPTLSFQVQRGPDAPTLAVDGDVVGVRPGEAVQVTVVLGLDAAQSYIDRTFSAATGRSEFGAVSEQLSITTFLTVAVDDHRSDDEGRLSFTVPDSHEPVVLHARVADNRRGVGFAALKFLATSESP